MKQYQVYCLDHEGRNVEVEAVMASGDEEAILKARTMTGLRQSEVWRGHHLVAKVTDFLSDPASTSEARTSL